MQRYLLKVVILIIYFTSCCVQVVKELRTEYAGAVALCAGRLSDILRTSPTTNIKIALSQPVPGFPPADMISQNYAAPQQVSSHT